MTADRLPASFRSLYRLILRTSSAAVLHRSVAQKHIRGLWRPMFDAAAETIHEIEDNKLPQTDLHKREQLLSLWEKRVDTTLSFLATSARSRGVSHQVVRNMNLLRCSNAKWVETKFLSTKRHWLPQLPPNSPEYEPTPLIDPDPRSAKSQARRRKFKEQDERCWYALGEVVRMAEGRHNLCLGRHRLRPWTFKFQ
ncbi:hypothetical protein F5I97DRAFT_1815822 [Phlebopus sp. FC_14]|nr:hypothetical protein F5I97DRAFT_1815822 [Phlebopus sp. FC_14]